MKKIFLLVLFVFLLNSCSWIKIIIEKECNCDCKKEIKQQNNKEVKINKVNNNLDISKEDFEKPRLIRYLTWKFTVNQDDNYTYVYYKNDLLAKFENNISNFSLDELEEKPIIKEEKDILKTQLAKKITITNLKWNFYLIELKNSSKKVLFDLKNKKSWNLDFVKSPFEKIIFWNTWKYLMYFWWKKCDWWLIYINNKSLELKKVFENDCNYIWEYPETYKEITNFELWDWVIKVYYINYLWDKNIEKIYLSDIK
jgi:hypothetical protein